MNQSPAPPSGADSVCPSTPWQIFMLRGEQWIPIGTCGSRALAESQAQVLRNRMRGYLFEVVLEGAINVAA